MRILCENVLIMRFDSNYAFICVYAFIKFRKPKLSNDMPFNLNICLKEVCRNGIMRLHAVMRLLFPCALVSKNMCQVRSIDLFFIYPIQSTEHGPKPNNVKCNNAIDSFKLG